MDSQAAPTPTRMSPPRYKLAIVTGRLPHDHRNVGRV
jgi:hypothetical protein